jgi:hypothetical protein
MLIDSGALSEVAARVYVEPLEATGARLFSRLPELRAAMPKQPAYRCWHWLITNLDD